MRLRMTIEECKSEAFGFSRLVSLEDKISLLEAYQIKLLKCMHYCLVLHDFGKYISGMTNYLNAESQIYKLRCQNDKEGLQDKQ